MGNVIGKTSTDIGGFIGNIFTAPFKATLGRSCLNVCSGPWDLTCFIEHFCLPDIAKLVLISLLCFIILVFFTLLFKLGICQCIVKSICKLTCAACAMYWLAIGEMVRCLWHSLSNTKRVNHRRKRLRDIEADTYNFPSDDESSSSSSDSHINNIRPNQRRRRIQGSKRNHHNRGSKRNLHNRGSNRHSRRLVRLRSRQMSVRVGGKSRKGRSMRKIKSSRAKRVKDPSNDSTIA